MAVLNIKVIMWSKYITWNYAREITAMLVSISSKKIESASFQNFWYKKYYLDHLMKNTEIALLRIKVIDLMITSLLHKI